MCVNNFGPSQRFLGVFVEFPKIVVTQNRGITDHKIFKYKPHPNIALLSTKNYSKHDMFL
jgi:hypothetical protein